MPNERRDPDQRSSTDQSLREERDRTDAELAKRSESVRDIADDEIARARALADSVLHEAREHEDREHQASSSRQIAEARAQHDAMLDRQREGRDAEHRDERERRLLALASLLAFERENTDLQLESERARADQALTSRDEFMAIVSHDLRNLLGGIALSAELLQGLDEHSLERVKHYTATIQRFAARMNRLVGDLMDLASIEAGKLSVIPAPRNLEQLLRDAVDAFGPAARAHGIELRCEGTPELGVAELDHERILQVLTNLVGNALKFTPRGGTIVIRVERRKHDVLFSVADSGQGIPSDLVAKVFERHFQTSPGARRGHGLGLFIAKSIVEQHGGTMWVDTKLGQGSTFYFTVAQPPAR